MNRTERTEGRTSRVEHQPELCSLLAARSLGEDGNPKNGKLKTLARQKRLRLSISHLPSASFQNRSGGGMADTYV